MAHESRAVDDLMGRMTLKQKVGQLFTQAFYGTLLTPDLRRTIKELNCGGLRITQYFRGFRRYARAGAEQESFDSISPGDVEPCMIDDRKDLLCKSPYMGIGEYAHLLDQVKEIANERPYNAPLHMMLDQEGGASFDCVRGGIRTFPAQFGYARRGDTDLTYQVCRAIATQLSAIGFNVINSPVVDIVFDPNATYIRTRSFGTEVETVCDMASAALRGFTDGGLVACAKHFPGRGATVVDAHHDVGAIDKSDEDLWNEDLAPYRRLIPEGLGAVMVGHSIYPAWDPENLASVSEKVINGILRERLKFDGMICTDSMIMGAIAKKYGVPRACVLSIKAGASAILMKECGPIRETAYRMAVEAAESGEISQDHIDELVLRNLRTKARFGLFTPSYWPDPSAAEDVVCSPEMDRIEVRAAEETVHLVRDEVGLLPLSRDARVLLVEEVPRQYVNANDSSIHPGIFWEQLLPHTDNISLVEVAENATDEDLAKVLDYAPFYDCAVVTFYKNKNVLSSTKIIERLLADGMKVVVVAANPLPYELPAEWPTVIATYGIMPPVLKCAAGLIYGAFEPMPPAVSRPWDR